MADKKSYRGYRAANIVLGSNKGYGVSIYKEDTKVLDYVCSEDGTNETVDYASTKEEEDFLVEMLLDKNVMVEEFIYKIMHKALR